MQPIYDILKEIPFPVWMCWGFGLFVFGMAVKQSLHKRASGSKTLLSTLPIQGMTVFIIAVGMTLYFSNDSAKRKKEERQRRARWQGELAAIKASPLIVEKKTVALDSRLQSIEGIIGYLDQSVKMEHEPQNLTPILLVLAKEIKKIRDDE